MDETPVLDGRAAAAIARAFLPAHPLGSRATYYYVRSKLATDPLYAGIVASLRGSALPLLDLGCGLGLLAHALRSAGAALPYRGVDNDTRKIVHAQDAAERAQLREVSFAQLDLAREIPAHAGNVAILDVLQFLPVEAQARLLDAAVQMLAPGGLLVLRTGLADGSWRARVTREVDRFSRWVRWMNAGPTRYPTRDSLAERFAAAGLQAEFTPLFGRTPFNNWRVVATRPT